MTETPVGAAQAVPVRRLDWTNVLFLGFAHLAAVLAVVWMACVHFSWATLALGVVWAACCGMSVTGGYHRLFAHSAYRARAPLRLLYLLFGAASVQNSALRWCAAHRVHHARTDTAADPYDITRGFWWAHVGWVFFKGGALSGREVRDLAQDPLLRFQQRFYVPLAILVGGVLPAGIAACWGDPLGGLLVAGFLRLVLQWHATFSVNSFAHTFGKQPYSKRYSAKDSFWVALLTLGEGYHNFHHAFKGDYRNGVRWWQFDPTKWMVWTLAKLRLASDLRRTPMAVIRGRRAAASAS